MKMIMILLICWRIDFYFALFPFVALGFWDTTNSEYCATSISYSILLFRMNKNFESRLAVLLWD